MAHVGKAQAHQSSIKKVHHRLANSPVQWDIFSIEFHSSKMTITYVKLIIKTSQYICMLYFCTPKLQLPQSLCDWPWSVLLEVRATEAPISVSLCSPCSQPSNNILSPVCAVLGPLSSFQQFSHLAHVEMEAGVT